MWHTTFYINGIRLLNVVRINKRRINCCSTGQQHRQQQQKTQKPRNQRQQQQSRGIFCCHRQHQQRPDSSATLNNAADIHNAQYKTSASLGHQSSSTLSVTCGRRCGNSALRRRRTCSDLQSLQLHHRHAECSNGKRRHSKLVDHFRHLQLSGTSSSRLNSRNSSSLFHITRLLAQNAVTSVGVHQV